jgi:NADPH:quinone reductase-like Zn-dependent oxidoreductase
MKALVATGCPGELVRFAEVEEPVPAAGEALVEVAAFSVNRGEIFQLQAPRPQPGWRPGKDIAGQVLRAAADGSGPAAGERVVAHPPALGWAERIAVPSRALVPLPAGVELAQAAALPLAGLTALRLLRAAGDVDGRRILLTGASGGVGHYVVELASAAGGKVTAITAGPERGHRLEELGATVAHDLADVAGPFDLVLESVGGPYTQLALSRLVRGGTLVWFGQASRVPATIDFFGFFAGPVSAVIRHFHYADSDVADCDDLAVLVGLVAGGRLHPEIGRVAGWADTAAVLDELERRQIRGNAVLLVG